MVRETSHRPTVWVNQLTGCHTREDRKVKYEQNIYRAYLGVAKPTDSLALSRLAHVIFYGYTLTMSSAV